jgi:hypothetical protein
MSVLWALDPLGSVAVILACGLFICCFSPSDMVITSLLPHLHCDRSSAGAWDGHLWETLGIMSEAGSHWATNGSMKESQAGGSPELGSAWSLEGSFHCPELALNSSCSFSCRD